MKIFFILLFLISIFIPVYASDIIIIEVEPNPFGNDSGNEWARLFNSGNNPVNLSGWFLNSTHSETKPVKLSGNIEPCADRMIKFPGEFLNNENESLVLYDKTGKVVDSTSKITDSADSELTWTTKAPKCAVSLDYESEIPSPIENQIQEEPASEIETNPESSEISPEIIEETEDNPLDFGFSIEQDDEFIEELNPNLPYIGIGIAVFIGVIIALVLRNSRKENDPSEVKKSKKKREIELIPMSEKFQEMKADSKMENQKIQDPNQFIEDKITLISKLQEKKIGDNERLESIKKSLITKGYFSLKDNKYLESQLVEYNKLEKKEFEEDES